MNKIDAAIEWMRKWSCELSLMDDGLKNLTTILEALQDLKDKECIAEQPDTIQDLDKLVSEKMCGDQLDQTEILNCYHRVKTALLAKQPDIERLKRVEGVLSRVHNLELGPRTISVKQALTDIRAMMEGRDV